MSNSEINRTLMIPYLVTDTETTTFQKGNPYSQKNKLCLLGIKAPKHQETKFSIFNIEYSDEPYADQLQKIQTVFNQTKLIVGFNLKFDLAWFKKYGLDFSHSTVFDCQLVHYILSGQTHSYPSLNEVAEHYGLGTKLDKVKTEYWDLGLDTTEVPLAILEEYLNQDLNLTEQIYLEQLKVLSSSSPHIQRLVSLCNQDLLVLLEMEYNGLKLDFKSMQEASNKCKTQIETIKKELNEYFNPIPSYCLNYNSGDCLSAILYGGTITEPIRTEVGVYQTGKKIGEKRYKIGLIQHILPRKVQPPKGSELKKEGYYATNEETLRRIKANKEDRVVLDKLLELSKLEKLNGTYLEGLIKLHEEKDWEPEMIHGQFNQCVARTGRLSSSSPNLQNFPPELDSYMVSRF